MRVTLSTWSRPSKMSSQGKVDPAAEKRLNAEEDEEEDEEDEEESDDVVEETDEEEEESDSEYDDPEGFIDDITDEGVYI